MHANAAIDTIDKRPKPEWERQNDPPTVDEVREAARVAPGEVTVIDTESYLPGTDRVTVRGHNEPGAWRIGMIGIAHTDAAGRITDTHIVDATGSPQVMFQRAAEKISKEKNPILSWNGRTFDVPVIRRDPTARALIDELAGREHIDIARWVEATKDTQRVTLTDGGVGVDSAAAVAQSIREPDTQPDGETMRQLTNYVITDVSAVADKYREMRALAKRSVASD